MKSVAGYFYRLSGWGKKNEPFAPNTHTQVLKIRLLKRMLRKSRRKREWDSKGGERGWQVIRSPEEYVPLPLGGGGEICDFKHFRLGLCVKEKRRSNKWWCEVKHQPDITASAWHKDGIQIKGSPHCPPPSSAAPGQPDGITSRKDLWEGRREGLSEGGKKRRCWAGGADSARFRSLPLAAAAKIVAC